MARTGGARTAFALLGGCVLLPYNCLLLGQPYFNDYPFKGMQFPFMSMISYSVSLCVAQSFLVFNGDNFTLNGRMTLAFIGTTLMAGALLLVTLGAHVYSASVMYTFAMVSIAFLGFLNALMQTALMGFAGSMGQEMSAACMLGFGISGILSLVLSLVVQAVNRGRALSQDMNGLIVTVAAFAFSLLYTIVSAWVYSLLCRRVPAAQEVHARLERRRSTQTLDSANAAAAVDRASGAISLMQSDGQGSAVPSEGRAAEPAPAKHEFTEPEVSKLRRTLAVLGVLAPQAFNVWLVFAVTMMIFPGVVTQWQPLPSSHFFGENQLFFTLLIGCFQVFDVVGRSLAGMATKCIPPARLWIFTVLRCVFIPVFMLGEFQPDWCALWGSDAGRMCLVAALATTNGMFATLGMMYGPERCSDEQREVAGIAMSCTMVTGIFSGSLLALLTQL